MTWFYKKITLLTSHRQYYSLRLLFASVIAMQQWHKTHGAVNVEAKQTSNLLLDKRVMIINLVSYI